ncbi:hypothetical protein PSYPI_49197, partial [Pseudomonas syringae pv. pisi str. 1704B]
KVSEEAQQALFTRVEQIAQGFDVVVVAGRPPRRV